MIFKAFSFLRCSIQDLSIIAFIFFILVPGQSTDAQELVQDTLVVRFPPAIDVETGPVGIDSVIDRRQEPSHTVGRYEVSKFFVVPVDLLICTENLLAQEITRTIGFDSYEDKDLRFRLFIDDFTLDKKTAGWMYPHYRLSASLGVHRFTDMDSSIYIGHLLYETSCRKSLFKDKLKKGYESVIHKWCNELALDLSHLSQTAIAKQPVQLSNFRKNKPLSRRLHMHATVDVIYGTQHWLADWAFYSSHREARKRFFRSGGYHLRYRNADDFEAIEFGLSIDHLFYRFDRNLMLRGKSQFMLGLNRWKDTDTVEHKLYDVLLLDYSLSQSLVFDSLDKRGVIFGIGILENVYTIYSKSVQFQAGLVFHAGLKL